jgi:hypothetical protein
MVIKLKGIIKYVRLLRVVAILYAWQIAVAQEFISEPGTNGYAMMLQITQQISICINVA